MKSIDRSSSIPVYRQVYFNIRNQIISGELVAGEKLPAKKELARELGVARNSVESAYKQLALEGYIKSHRGTCSTVENIDIEMLSCIDHSQDTIPLHLAKREEIQHNHYPLNCLVDQSGGEQFDFSYGNRSSTGFPAQQWREYSDQALKIETSINANSYIDPFGLPSLRYAIMNWMKSARGVSAPFEQILLQPGTQAALSNILFLFDRPCKVAFEDPGYDCARKVFERLGCEIIPISCAHGFDRFLEDIEKSDADIIWVTPSNQFPLGYVMPVAVRLKLLKIAEATGAYIIEDDYCCEYRYETSPVLSLRSLDRNDQVIYMGTLSKILTPAIRLSYIVLPQSLVERWKIEFDGYTCPISWLTQETLKIFMTEGKWNTYIWHTVNKYKHRHDALIRSLRREMGDDIDIIGDDAGQHLLVNVHTDDSCEELIQKAAELDVRVYDIRSYMINDNPEIRDLIFMGYSSIPEDKIPEAVRRLRKAWF